MTAQRTSHPPVPRAGPGFPRAARLLAFVSLLGLLVACAAPPPSLAELNASYDRALARTAPLAGRFEPGSPGEKAALDRVAGYFDGLTPARVAAETGAVYAPEAYLNDTLVGIDGAGAIRDYFGATMERAEELRVRFLDVARSGAVVNAGMGDEGPAGVTDYYVRWEMTVRSRSLGGGAPIVTYGVTHFRFDPEGRVLIHKDYWDAGTGLYEHLPVLGRLVQRVRALAHGE